MVPYTHAAPDDLPDAWHEEVNVFCHAGILGVRLHVEGFQRRREMYEEYGPIDLIGHSVFSGFNFTG